MQRLAFSVAVAVLVLGVQMPSGAQQDPLCSVGLVVAPGERCVYPGTSTTFSVDSAGQGRFLFFTSGGSISLRSTTINGVSYDFEASKQPDGTWIIVVAGAAATQGGRDDAATGDDGELSGRVLVAANGSSLSDVGTAASLVAASVSEQVLFADSAETLGTEAAGVVRESRPQWVVLVGGAAALGEGIEEELRRLAPGVSIKRLAGRDRVDTAARAARLAIDGRASVSAVIANGWSLSDVGTAASAVASGAGDVVLYAGRDQLGAPTAAVLGDHQFVSVRIVGGTAALSNAVEAQIRSAAGGATVTRQGGTTRLHTAALFAESAFEAGANHAVIANGWSLSDVGRAAALAAADPRSAVLYTERRTAAQLSLADFESSAPEGYVGVTVRDSGVVWGTPDRFTTDSDLGTVAYMLLGSAGGCRVADASAARDATVYIRTAELGSRLTYESVRTCSHRSRSWVTGWEGLRITHLRVFDASSPTNVIAYVYDPGSGAYVGTTAVSMGGVQIGQPTEAIISEYEPEFITLVGSTTAIPGHVESELARLAPSSSITRAHTTAEGHENNRPPRFTSSGSFETSENDIDHFSVSAVDDDAADTIISYTITGGADRSRFELSITGRLSFSAAPDYEHPSDAGADNSYELQVTVTSGAGTRELTAAQTITVKVTDVNEAPSKSDSPTVSSTTENSITVTWHAPINSGPAINDYDIQYRPQGTTTWLDWPHTGSTQTAVITGLTADAPYVVRVRATNPEGTSDWSNALAVTTAGAQGANRPARFTTPASHTLAENRPGHFTVSAVDDDTGDSVTNIEITGGADMDKFTISPPRPWQDRGRYSLSFRPGDNSSGYADYENPTDANSDNTYEVTVTVTSGTGSRELTATQTINVEVTNVREVANRPAVPTVSSTTETTVTVDWARPYISGGTITGYEVQYRAQNANTWLNWPHSGTDRSTTITGLSTNTDYDVRVRAMSPEGVSDWSPPAWATAAIGSPPSRPGNVRWTQIGTSERVRVSWNAAPDATYYKIYHCSSFIQDFGCTLRVVESRTTGTEHIHSVTGASPFSTTYLRYAVSACNGFGCSTSSSASRG